MQEKLPYYMAYPMPSLLDDTKQDKRDMDYLKSLYPNTVKIILMHVEDECDRLEYEGSMMYDEYPDQLQMHMVCSRICKKVQEANQEESDMMQQEVEAQNRFNDRRPGFRPRPPQNDPLRDIVQVLFFQELMRRRYNHRQRWRKYY